MTTITDRVKAATAEETRLALMWVAEHRPDIAHDALEYGHWHHLHDPFASTTAEALDRIVEASS